MKKLSIGALSTLIISGFIFLGCENATDSSAGPPAGPTEEASSRRTVTVFGYSGTPETRIVTSGEKISRPADPTPPTTDATFDGWSKNGGIETWDFDKDVITEDITLCARWKFKSIPSLTAFLQNISSNAMVPGRHMAEGIDPNPAEYPIPVGIGIQLTPENWGNLVNGIEGVHKKVSLDLSDCTPGGHTSGGGLRNDNSFQPVDSSVNLPASGRVNNTIIGLILPSRATVLQEATTNLNLIQEIRGENIQALGTSNISFHGGLLARVYFPKLTDIKTALADCGFIETADLPEVTKLSNSALYWTSIKNVNIPKVTEIGNNVFQGSGKGDLTITLGDTPPKLGINTFSRITQPKNVTVRVPASSKQNYTATWIEGLTGKGWNSENGVGTGPIAENIKVTILGY